MATRFIHTADWHLGKPFASIKDDQKRAQLQQERIRAIARIAAVAKKHEVGFVVVCGDLFDSPTADRSVVAAGCAAIGRIPCPVYVIPGNHDHGGPGSVWQQPFFQRQREELCANLQVLDSPTPVEREDAILLPCPLLRRQESLDTTTWVREWLAQSDQDESDRPRIILAHGSTQLFVSTAADDDEFPAVNVIDVAGLDAAKFDYLALGDWHGTKEIADKAWFAGTPEIDRFPKGDGYAPGQVLVVEATRGSPAVVSAQATHQVGWHVLAFSFTAESDLDIFQTRWSELLEQRVGEDLLELSLEGSLSLEGIRKLEEQLESLQARLLRLKLSNQVIVTPSAEEIAELKQSQDPLVAAVATRLIDQIDSDPDPANVARQALRELHSRLPTA